MVNKQRRAFFTSVGVTAFVGMGACSTASATNKSLLQGRIVDHNGDPISNGEVTLFIREGSGHGAVNTDEDGRFEAEVPANETCDVGFYRYKSGTEPSEPNGVPHLYVIGAYSTGTGETNLGELQIAEGHLVQIRALDSDGDPVGDVNAELSARGETGHYLGTGSGFATNHAGYVKVGNQYTGVELVGNIEFSMAIPTEDSGALQYSRDFYIDEPLYITVQAGEGIEVTSLSEHKSETEDSGSKESSDDTSGESSEDHSDSSNDTQDGSSETNSDSSSDTQNGTTDDSSIASGDQNETDSNNSNQSRGFFSNDTTGDELEMLSDPLTLTVAGFVLSAGGIAHQLIRGR